MILVRAIWRGHSMVRVFAGICLLLGMMFFPVTLPVQAQMEVLPIRTFTTDDGLSHGTIYDVHTDHQGLLWVATANGLEYFDGLRFRALPDLSRGRIRLIEPAPENGLWIARDTKLYRLDQERRSSLVIEKLVARGAETGSIILSIASGPNGNLYLGTDHGLFRYNLTQKRATWEIWLNELVGFGGEVVRGLQYDRQGNLWVGTFGGLIRIHPDGSRELFINDARDMHSLSNNSVRQIFQDSSHRLWIATNDGLCLWEEQNQNFIRFMANPDRADSISDNWINALEEDHQGNIWVATRNGGVDVLSPEGRRIRTYQETNPENPGSGLPTNNMISFHFAQPNLMWIGAYNAGLACIDLNPRTVRSFRPARNEKQVSDAVRTLLEDSRHRLWLGNAQGLIRQDPDTLKITHYQHDPQKSESLGDDFVISLAEDSPGRIWIGTFSQGADILDPKTGKFLRLRHDPRSKSTIPNGSIMTMMAVEDEVWLGTWNGLARVNNRTLMAETIALPNHGFEGGTRIYGLDRGAQTGLWAGAIGLFYRLEQGTDSWLAYPRPQDESVLNGNNSFFCFYEDPQGRTWIGSNLGLYYYEPGSDSFGRYQDKLPGSAVRALFPGEHGEIWVGTNAGVARINRDRVLQTYDHKDGMICSEITRGAACRLGNGAIYMGGPRGYHLLNPNFEPSSQFTPKVVITGINISGEEEDRISNWLDSNRIQIPRGQNFFTIEFASLDFSNPSRNQYAYTMDESGGNWIQANERNQASYVNLPGGSYHFRVKGTNSEGVWSDQEAQIELIIPKALWARRWFQILSLVVLIGLVLLVHALLTSRSRKHRQELIQLAATRSETLGDLHQQLLDEARKAGIAEITTGVLHNIGNILNSIGVSATRMSEDLQRSQPEKLRMANDLMRQHSQDLREFFLENPKGKMLVPFYRRVISKLAEESGKVQLETDRMLENINLMSRIITLEQGTDQTDQPPEPVNLRDLLEDALELQKVNLQRRQIEVIREYAEIPACRLDRFRLTHVLINLIRNASDALELVTETRQKTIKVTLSTGEDGFNRISIRDNGCGIARKNLPRVFSYGFTTKKTGNGFGLHSCQLTISEMGGTITVGSRGLGKGAVFILKIPIAQGQSL